jgi:nucleoside-diphosphate-sugar epimerase
MMIHAEVHHPTLCVALLRLATVVTCEGEFVLSPGGLDRLPLRALGYDPMCPLVVDRDVVQAAIHALHLRARGVFNIAGDQSVPLSALDRARHSWRVAIPGPLLSVLGRGLESLGAGSIGRRLDAPQLRYGKSLETERARSELGFKPTYRITLHPPDHRGPILEARPI